MARGFIGLIAGIGLALIGSAGLVARDDAGADWDVTKPRGETLEIDFTTSEGTWMSVDLSPDGRWIVFDLLGHIYRLPSAGGEAECLTQASGIAVNYHPRYSPDGTHIAFVSDRGGQDNLWVMDADGAAPRAIQPDLDARVAEPAWMPDGQSILVTRRLKTSVGFYRTTDVIWRYPLAGGPGALVLEQPASGTSTPARMGFWVGSDRLQWPAPSPDGRYVYFHASLFSDEARHLERIELASGHVDNVTEATKPYLANVGAPADPLRLGEIAPELSPDGRWLAFARKLPEGRTSFHGVTYRGRTALWLRDLGTGVERVVMDPITSDAMELHAPWDTRALPGYAWARDGRSIVISQGGRIRRLWPETGKVDTIPFVARVHRTISQMARGHVRIADDAFEAHSIRWPASSPDGAHLVFIAAGRLWLVDLPDGTPRPLTPATPGAFEMTPTWSPDGRWIVYTTWSDAAGGRVWKVGLDGAAPQPLTSPGHYLYPHVSPDGTWILVNRWASALAYAHWNNGWELVRVPIGGGEPVTITPPGELTTNGFAPNGRVARYKDDTLSSIAADGSDPKTVAKWVGFPFDARLSPDGRWLAVWQKQDVYVVDLSAVTGTPAPPIDVEAPSPGVTRLSHDGGIHPRWRNATTLEFISANRYMTYDVQSHQAASVDLHVKVARDVAHGTIALTGARLITLDHRRVIPSGTVLVKDGRITCLGVCDTTGAKRVVDLRGATIIPGLVDVHAHHLGDDGSGVGVIPQHRSSSASYLAYGVTTVHDPATDVEDSFAISELVEAGRIVGPRTYSTGPSLTCSPTDDLREIRTYADAEEHIDRTMRQGAPSIKDYKQCTRIQREMLEDVARRRGVTITSEGADLMYLLGLVMGGSTGWEHPIQIHPFYSDVARFFGLAKAHYSAQLLLSGYPFGGSAFEYWLSRHDLWQDPKVMHWSPWQKVSARRRFDARPLEDYILALLAQSAASLKRAGGFLPVGAHGEQPGLGTHWELWSYAMGLTPMEALEAGTADGAHFLGLEDEVGSLKVGLIADLVVLNANPLVDIRRTTDIRLVMKAGRLYDGLTLDEVWPSPHPYGSRPWARPDVSRTDLRPDDYWDRK